jgi:hypothetical protein
MIREVATLLCAPVVHHGKDRKVAIVIMSRDSGRGIRFPALNSGTALCTTL